MSRPLRRRLWGAGSGTAVFDAAALCVAALIAYAVFQQRREPAALMLGAADWQELATSELTLGSNDARVVVVEFVDYQCPMCFVVDGLLAELERDHPGLVRRVVRHFPLTRTHPRADSAAALATCAAAQGAFSQMHRVLFERRDLVERGRWDSLTALVAIPSMEEPGACFRSADAFRRVAEDVRFGRRLGVSSTPTLVVDREWLANVNPPRLRDLLLRRLD